MLICESAMPRFSLIFPLVLFVWASSHALASDFSEVMDRFGEKELSSYRASKEGSYLAYRLLWRRSSDGDMVFRAVLRNDGRPAELVVKKSSPEQ